MTETFFDSCFGFRKFLRHSGFIRHSQIRHSPADGGPAAGIPALSHPTAPSIANWWPKQRVSRPKSRNLALQNQVVTPLRQDGLYDFAADIGQAEVAAGVAEG